MLKKCNLDAAKMKHVASCPFQTTENKFTNTALVCSFCFSVVHLCLQNCSRLPFVFDSAVFPFTRHSSALSCFSFIADFSCFLISSQHFSATRSSPLLVLTSEYWRLTLPPALFSHFKSYCLSSFLCILSFLTLVLLTKFLSKCLILPLESLFFFLHLSFCSSHPTHPSTNNCTGLLLSGTTLEHAVGYFKSTNWVKQ